MTKKHNRHLRTKTVRLMLNESHFKFLEKLKNKCKEKQNILIIPTEEYTSKTCGVCGKLNKPHDRDYKCLSCGVEIDRDINGARNILLKCLEVINLY